MNSPLNQSLHCHHSQVCTSVSRISVAVDFTENQALRLRYGITGSPLLPPAQAPAAADNLWQHTCCELFIAGAEDGPYREFNFSPAGLWAAYHFTAYRQPDQDIQPPITPQTRITRHANGFELEALIADQLLPPGKILRLGLTAVIESESGDKTHWALAHLADQPDFHLRPSFTLSLPRPCFNPRP